LWFSGSSSPALFCSNAVITTLGSGGGRSQSLAGRHGTAWRRPMIPCTRFVTPA
jgi:hypothetical protein